MKIKMKLFRDEKVLSNGGQGLILRKKWQGQKKLPKQQVGILKRVSQELFA